MFPSWLSARSVPLANFALSGLILLFMGPAFGQTGRRALIRQRIDEARIVRLAGNTRPEANVTNDQGAAAPELRLDMYLQLKRSPEQDLAAQQFVESLTDRNSPNYHKWITAAEYGQRFGAAAEDIAAVTGWLESHGFAVNNVPSNNMVIDFSGAAAQVQEAFHTEIHNLQVGGRSYFANMSDPSIPAALLPAVTGVVSLSNFKPHSMMVPKKQYAASSSYQAIVPGDLATIYNLGPAFAGGFTGQGQTVVVVEDTDLYNGTDDWKTFRTKFGLDQYASGSLTQLHPGPGKGGTCTDPGVNGDDVEAALDVEWASAAAPNAAIVMASCADTSNFGGFIALQNMLTNGGPLPSVVSVSYGESETQSGATFNSYINTLYQTAAAAGVSVFVSTGDSNASVVDRGNPLAIYGVNVSSFASTPYNVAVGGTDFGDTAAKTTGNYWNSSNGTYFDSAKSYVPEIPWNDSCGSTVLAGYWGYSTTYGLTGLCNARYNWLDTDGGSGGPSGCATGSTAVPYAVSGTCAGTPKPSWQSVVGNPSDGVRDIPDVSLFASAGFWGHYYVFCVTAGGSCSGAPSNWPGAGGTSFSSPIMAGIQAVINQAVGTTNVGNPNPVYYQIAQSQYGAAGGLAACNSSTGPAANCSFNDVTQGDIDIPCAGDYDCFMDGAGIGVLSTSKTSYAPAYAATPGWDFTTGIGTVNAFNLLTAFLATSTPSAAPPSPPALISPANQATGVSAAPVLSWRLAVGAASYDVHFGTSPTPPLVANTAGASYSPGGLSASTTYYWAVGAKNAVGTNVSATWSFTTGCVAGLSPSAGAVGPVGGAFTIPVTASSGCAWTAASNAAWITITSGASGSGNGTVGFTVSAAGTASRVGLVLVGGQAFTVTQSGYSFLISTLAGGAMPATAAQGTSLSIPVGYSMAADASGNVYFASTILNAVFKADSSGMVTRIAGTGLPGYSGDGGPALGAKLSSPYGVAVDAVGNVYIADRSNYRVRRVDPSGNIATVAGTGSCCSYNGDGGAATSAQIGSPFALAVDSAGNLYFSDTNNYVIRMVSPVGIISTVAGTGASGYSGDGGAATSAQIAYAYGLATDGAGNLYIADTGNYRVRKVSAGRIATVAGNGVCCYSGDGGAATSASLASPYGVALDSTGNLYIADSSGERIRKVTAGGTISTIAGSGSIGFTGDGGPAPSATLYSPNAIAADGLGNLYIAELGNVRVRRINAAGNISTFVGGNAGEGGLGVMAALNQPYGVARDGAGNTYVSDTNNNRVRKIAPDGTISTFAGTGLGGYAGDGGQAVSARLSFPRGLALDAAGNLYIADTSNYRVRKVSPSGTISTVAGYGSCCTGSNDGGPATSARIGSPYAVAVDSSGNLYIGDVSNNQIRKVNASGIISTLAGDGTYGYAGDGGPAAAAEFRDPYGLAVDSSGNVYVADRYNYRVRMINAAGTISTVAGNGSSCCTTGDGGQATSANVSPTGVAVDGAGNLYIAEYVNRIRMVGAGGIISTVAGNGTAGYMGDGGPAVSALMNFPWAIAVDSAGAVAAAEYGNNAVRLLTPAGTQPVLSVSSAHSGALQAGSRGSYTLTVANGAGAAAASGTVTVTEILPVGLTLATMSGSGWSCGASACTRGDSLAGGASYPAIAVSVNVGAVIQPQITNQVSVSGGGSAPAGAQDLTQVSLAGALKVTLSHSGNFTQGQTGATYSLLVSNSASTPTSGAVAVSDTLPAGLALVSMTGTGWNCASNLCARSDALSASASYPPITVTVQVSADAASPVVNSAGVSGGGSATAVATDSTIVTGPCSYSISAGGQAFAAAGGSAAISVTTQSGCQWTAAAPSGQSWLSITSGGGTGGGLVNYRVQANSGGPRSTSLTVAGFSFLVQQASGATTSLVSAGSLAQIAAGGGWNTTITLVNTSATATSEAVVNFYDQNGNPLTLPLIYPGMSAGAPLMAASLDQTLAAGAQLMVQTAGASSGTSAQGWAQLLTTGAPGDLGGSAVFGWTLGGGVQEAVVPVETRTPATGFVLPFNYTNGYSTGVAIANVSNQAVSVSVTLHDKSGAAIPGAAPISLPPYGHTSFMLGDAYPGVVAAGTGTAEFDATGGQIGVLGIRAAPDFAVTSVPVLAR